MSNRIVSTIGQVAASALGIVGVRIGTEEPAHTSRRLTDAVEIRRYEPRIAAQTTVDADEEQARRGSIAPQMEKLSEVLRANDIEMSNEPMTWFYDPPWTLAFRRRNEVVVSVPEGS